MLAQKNEYLQETVSGIAQLTEEEKIRQHCQAREDYEYWEYIRNMTHQREMQEQKEALRQKDEVLRQQGEELRSAQEEISRLRAEIETLKRPSK